MAWVEQILACFRLPADKARIESLLPLKIQELLRLADGSAGGRGLAAWLQSLPPQKNPELSVLMETHFRESLSQEQWAFLAGLSLSSFKRRFEAAYGMPPRKWIQRRRLQEAYQLLARGRMNVSEVCYAVGFENPAHFIQAFRQQYHITPKQRMLGKEAPLQPAA